MHDLKFALRLLWKSPAFTAVAGLSLALGIGANTTVFCWMQEVLWRPLPGVPRSDQIVVLCSSRGPQYWDTVSLPDLRDYAALTNVFAGIIGSQVTPACLTLNEKPEWMYGQITTANFFDVLGVKPLLGRTFLAEEDTRPGGAPVLVLSELYWQRRFGGDPSVIGQTVDVNRHTFTIVGVVPAAFRGTMSGLRCDFWAPLVMHEQVANFGSLTTRGDRWLHTQARLPAGVTRSEAQAAVNSAAAQLAAAYPDSNQEIGLRVLPVWQAPYGGQAMLRPVLGILFAVSLGVLLIVAANVANLLLARATARAKEVAIRLALGAGRLQLIRQFLTESLALAVLGGVLGVVFAHWGATLFKHFLPPTYLPVGYTFEVDRPTLLFTLAVTLVTGLAFGLAPAFQAARQNLDATLKEGGRTPGSSLPNHRLRSVLVVGEVALAMTLLVAAGLCLEGSRRAQRVDIGFDPQQVLVAGLRVGMHGYAEEQALGFYRQLRERLATTPGVQAVGLASWLPLGFEGGSSLGIQVPGYDRAPNEDMGAQYAIISPGYFAALKIPLLAGRDFTDQDDATRARVAIINETMARRFWPGQDPLGRTFTIWGGQRELTVIGVVKDGKYRFLQEAPKPFVYFAYQQGAWDLNLGIAVRTEAEPLAFAGTLRQAIRAVDPGVEVWALLAMTDYIQAAFLGQRIVSTLLTALGLVALFLAAMGIYGVMTYLVSQRTHEVGIRLALGASAGGVMQLVVGEGMRLVGVGLGLGVLGALALSRSLASFLYGLPPFDPVILGTVAVVLTLASLTACLVPAWRAARVDPMVALRTG
jgi:predicted permease